MKALLFLVCFGVAVSGVTAWVGPLSRAAPEAEGAKGVELPKDDPLLGSIQKRFGKPDRVTGSGRMFIHYDLANGDTLTIAVSSGKVIGTSYETKK